VAQLFSPCNRWKLAEGVVKRMNIPKGCDTCSYALESEVACSSFRERWQALCSEVWLVPEEGGEHDSVDKE